MTIETKKLHEDRAALVTEMQNIAKNATAEKRDLTTEENTKFDLLDTKQESMLANIARIEKIYALTATEQEKFLQEAKDKKVSPDGLVENAANESKAFRQYLIHGFANIKPEEKQILSVMQSRAQSAGVGSEGGFLVPEGFQAQLVTAMKNFGGVREVAQVISTATGNDIPYPNMNDTSSVGAILSENTAAADLDIVFGSTTLKAFKYTSKGIPVSIELLQDSALSIETIISNAMAERLGRITNNHFTLGTGSGQPQGIVTAASEGAVTATTTAVTFGQIMDLVHSVDPAYRKNGKFVMNDSTLKAIKKLSIGSADARPLWDAGISTMGAPATIDGYQYVINQDVASMAASAKFLLFGDFNYYILRDVVGFTLLRLVERYAEKGQVGFLAFSRHDGRKVSSDNPFKFLRNATS